MNVNISLCNQENLEGNSNLYLSDNKFFELWHKYLNLPFERRLFTPKEVINAIDEKLDPNYELNKNSSNLLDIIKKLEDICIMGLINQDTICVRVEK